MRIVSFSDNEDLLVGMYDYGMVSHPIHEEERVAKALSELTKIARQEASLQLHIADLARPYVCSPADLRSRKIVDLDSYRDFLRRLVRP